MYKECIQFTRFPCLNNVTSVSFFFFKENVRFMNKRWPKNLCYLEHSRHCCCSEFLSMCFQLVSFLPLPFPWGTQDKCFFRVCIFCFCCTEMHFKSIQCSKTCYWHHEWFSLVSSCSDHPVTNVLDGASSVLANWLHEAAKLPLPGCMKKTSSQQLLSLTERERKRRGYRENESLSIVDSVWKSLGDLLSFFTDSA